MAHCGPQDKTGPLLLPTSAGCHFVERIFLGKGFFFSDSKKWVERLLFNGYRISVGDDKKVLELHSGDGGTTV